MEQEAAMRGCVWAGFCCGVHERYGGKMSQQERVWTRSNVVVSNLSMAGFLDLVFPDGPFAPSLASTERKLVMDGFRSVHVKLLPRDIITGEIALSKMEGDDISFPVGREGSYYPPP